MRDKYANKSPVMQILHRYTGLIVVMICLPIMVFVWMDYDKSQMFFEAWPCNTINSYAFLDNVRGFPSHDELSEDEHVRFHEIYEECNSGEFTDGMAIKHGD